MKMCARDKDEELEDEFEVHVRRQRELMERGRREKGQSFWQYVGLIGAVGWSVVVPMVLGALLGLWIDGKYGTRPRWTVGLLLLGLCVGCVNAWRTITKEQ
jgi:ATP synthase protein I